MLPLVPECTVYRRDIRKWQSLKGMSFILNIIVVLEMSLFHLGVLPYHISKNDFKDIMTNSSFLIDLDLHLDSDILFWFCATSCLFNSENEDLALYFRSTYMFEEPHRNLLHVQYMALLFLGSWQFTYDP